MADAEECQGDSTSTSRDDILPARDIYSTKTQGSIVEYLTLGNTEKEDLGEDSLMKQKSVRERRLQDDSPVGKKKKPLPGPSSGKMVEIMRKFVKQGQEDNYKNVRQEVSGTSISSKEQEVNRTQQVEEVQEVQVPRKQSVSFASIDVRVKKTFSSSSVKDRVSAINGVTEELKCVLGSG